MCVWMWTKKLLHESECPICLDKYTKHVATLSCSHTLHLDCLYQLILYLSPRCMICRRKIKRFKVGFKEYRIKQLPKVLWKKNRKKTQRLHLSLKNHTPVTFHTQDERFTILLTIYLLNQSLQSPIIDGYHIKNILFKIVTNEAVTDKLFFLDDGISYFFFN